MAATAFVAARHLAASAGRFASFCSARRGAEGRRRPPRRALERRGRDIDAGASGETALVVDALFGAGPSPGRSTGWRMTSSRCSQRAGLTVIAVDVRAASTGERRGARHRTRLAPSRSPSSARSRPSALSGARLCGETIVARYRHPGGVLDTIAPRTFEETRRHSGSRGSLARATGTNTAAVTPSSLAAR